jgi:sigma-E factor negative regulatory protein RseA
MAAAVASVVWVARPLLVPEMGQSNAQVAATPATNVVASNADMPAVRDYVSAHRQISGPSAVRQVSFGASR